MDTSRSSWIRVTVPSRRLQVRQASQQALEARASSQGFREISLTAVSSSCFPTSGGSRAPYSPSPRLQWSTTPQDWAQTPRSCRAAIAVGSRRSAGVARRKPQALKTRQMNSRGRGRCQCPCPASAGRRSQYARKAKPRPRTASTSGLCGALSRYLTASPSLSPPSHLLCPPSPWPRDPATWRMGPEGLSPARGPGPCPARCLSSKSLFYVLAMNSLPFTK